MDAHSVQEERFQREDFHVIPAFLDSSPNQAHVPVLLALVVLKPTRLKQDANPAAQEATLKVKEKNANPVLLSWSANLLPVNVNCALMDINPNPTNLDALHALQGRTPKQDQDVKRARVDNSILIRLNPIVLLARVVVDQIPTTHSA